MTASMLYESGKHDFGALDRSFTLGDLVGVTNSTRIKVINYDNDILILRYDIARPLVYFYVVDFREEPVPQDAQLIFQVNTKELCGKIIPT